MKYFIYFLLLLAAAMTIYNITLIDFSDPLGEESIVAVITVLAGLCCLLILVILLVSRKIKEKTSGKS